jgi:ribosome-binding factor A
VAEQMQRELADLLMFELKDPRVNMVTITGVEVTGDSHHVDAWIFKLKHEQISKLALHLLCHAVAT